MDEETPAEAAEDASRLLLYAPAAGVRLSPRDKAVLMLLSDDGLSASSRKGYRTVRATHGVAAGAWYCEVRLAHLGETGHARLGWCV